MSEPAPPIPVPDPDVDALIFRTTFTRFFITTSVAGLAWSLPLVISTTLPIRSMPTFLSANGIGISAGLAFGALCTVTCMYLFPVVVHAQELRSTNVWGKTARIAWRDMTSIKRTHFMTLPYLKISTHQKKIVMWLPLFLSDLKGFREAVEKYTAPENPLRRELEKIN